MSWTNCPNCGAPRDLEEKQCPYCETPYHNDGMAPDAIFLDGRQFAAVVIQELEKGILSPNEARRRLGLEQV